MQRVALERANSLSCCSSGTGVRPETRVRMMVFGDLRGGQFGGQGCGRGLKGADPRDHFIGNIERVQFVHLFPDGAVDRGITGMESDHVAARVGACSMILMISGRSILAES